MPKSMDIAFPARGVVRRLGLRAEASGRRESYSTPWAVNVRLEDSLTERLRGGSFTAQASGGAKASPVYRDRAITFSGNAITAARQGDSSDTALSTDISDTRRPILFQLSLADAIGGDVVAVVPHKDAYMLCFTAGETWVLAGDPATGALRRVSDECGIVGANAWCVAHDTVYFLSSHGLHSVGADGGGLKPLSEDAIPEELTGVTDAITVLDYNHADRGVYIHIPDADVSWFYDAAREGFWPFDRDETDSHVLLGPFRLGDNSTSFGRMLHLYGITAAGSASVTWRVVLGGTAEEAAANGKTAITTAIADGDFSSYVHSSGTWTAGINHRSYPRARSKFAVLWLSSAGTWGYESVSIRTEPSGAWR